MSGWRTIGMAVVMTTMWGACSDDDAGSRDIVDVTATETMADTAVGDTAVTDSVASETAGTETAATETVAEVADDAADVATETADDTSVEDSVATDTAADAAETSPSTVLGAGAELTAAGFNFGECLESCSATVTFAGASLQFRLQDNQGTVEHEANGMLTTGGAAELQNLVGALEEVPLQAVYGCPDCNDGGSRFFTFTTSTEPFTTTYEYSDPPAALADLSTFVAEVIDALRTCTGDERTLIQGQCPLPER